MVRTYRLGGAERERARALIRILSIDMDRVRWLDGHPMTVRVFDDGKCWVEYTGLVVCDKEDIDFCLRGLEPNHLAQLRYQKKGPRYIQATPRTVLYRQSDIEDWLTANTVETEDSKEIKKASAATDAGIK